MTSLLVGAHASIARGFVVAAEHTFDTLHGTALQIFLKSPRGGTTCKLTDAEAQNYRAYVEPRGIFTVAHCSYLLNFGKPLTTDSWPLKNLIEDVMNLARLGGAGVVLHVGKSLELPRETALAYIAENIATVLKKTERTGVSLFLENTAGQGTELGYTFDELATILRLLRQHPRVRFCLDTCHAFAAGYDIRTPAGVADTFARFDAALGLDRLACIHFNDSKVELGKRVDRHASLGSGLIGLGGLAAVARFAAKRNIPLILETPDETKYADEIAMVKEWVAQQ